MLQASHLPLDRLVDEIQEVAAWLVVEERGLAVFIDKALGSRAVQTHASVGTHSHLHYLASSQSILEHMPRERVEAVVEEHGLPAQTENSISDPAILFEELDEVRQRGFSTNATEAVHGAHAIGRSILVDGDIRGAVSIVGPIRVPDGSDLGEKAVSRLLGTTNAIELRLGSSRATPP